MILYFSNNEICGELHSLVSSTTSQHTSDEPQIVHNLNETNEPFQLSEFSKDDVDTDLPFGLPKELQNKKPMIKITASESTGTSTNCSTESIVESQSNSTAGETLQTSNSTDSSTTEVDIVQEARSPYPSNPVRVHIQYSCSLYQDSNYVPPNKLSRMIGEMIKDGMPRLMRKIVAETKLVHKKPASIFNFDVLPQKQDAAQSHSTIDPASEDFAKSADLVSKESETPDLVKTCYTLSSPPNKSNVCRTVSSDSAKSSDGEVEKVLSGHSEADQHSSPKKRSITLPQNITDLIKNSKLHRSHSLMSEQRRMEILRNMSQSVKDRLRRHSSSVAASSAPSNLDLCPTSPNSSPMNNTPTGSHNSSPTSLSINITVSSTVKKPQASNEPFVPIPKNKVRRWISFNYGDKTKSKTAQKYMKHLEQT